MHSEDDDAPHAPAYRTYLLNIVVTRPLVIAVGRLGPCAFPPGRYTYAGSAVRGFEARIRRHLSATKRMHWHIDYLLAAPGVSVADVERFAAPECEVNRETPGEVVIVGFGATDCRARCGSHLKRVGPV